MRLPAVRPFERPRTFLLGFSGLDEAMERRHLRRIGVDAGVLRWNNMTKTLVAKRHPTSSDGLYLLTIDISHKSSHGAVVVVEHNTIVHADPMGLERCPRMYDVNALWDQLRTMFKLPVVHPPSYAPQTKVFRGNNCYCAILAMITAHTVALNPSCSAMEVCEWLTHQFSTRKLTQYTLWYCAWLLRHQKGKTR